MTDTVVPWSPEALEAACRSVSQLVSAANGPLRRMHVRVGDIAVEVEWPEAPGTPVVVPQPATGANLGPEHAAHGVHYVCAPGVGTYYHTPEPGAEPFVSVGETVVKGQSIGILEVMKLMIPVEADRAGRVGEVFVGNGEPVEYGQPLLSIVADPVG